MRYSRAYTYCSRKTHHRVQDVLIAAGLDPPVGEQPLVVACTGKIVAKSYRRIDHAAQPVGSHRRMHTQRNVEATAAKLLANVCVSGMTFALIENDKLNARNIGHQASFCFADNPGDSRFGPGVLNSTNDGKRMTSIANRRKANDTNTFRWRLLEHFLETGKIANVKTERTGLNDTVEKTRNGAIVYDTSLINQISDATFTAGGWSTATPVTGVLRSAGRGNTLIVCDDQREYVLRHYMRGGLPGRLIRDRYLWSGEARTRSFASRLTALLIDLSIVMLDGWTA